MGKTRIVCYGSDVYHKLGCRYVDRMLQQNQLQVTRDDAIRHGCRICRYCNSMNHHVYTEDSVIEYFKRNGMQFKYIDGILYVKTEISCWKLVYVRAEEKLTLFHRNASSVPVNFEHPEHERYHHQDDVPYASTISKYLNYISEHDRYKAVVMNGETVTSFSSRRSKNLAKKSDRKRSINRVNYLFRCLERENDGYKQMSFS